ncbi:hypothetical protein D3C71_2188450 [compost metagenome]
MARNPSVPPIPSFTAVMILASGMPAARPVPMAVMMSATNGLSLAHVMSSNNTAMAATTIPINMMFTPRGD